MNHLNITIEPFQNSDLEAIRSLILSIVETEISDVPPETYMNDLDNIHKCYSGPKEGFWIAKNGHKVIGTIAIKDDGGDGMIRRFFVNPHYRSQGVGRKLIDHVIVYARENDFKKIYFVGNTKLHKTRKTMVYFGFDEVEEISLGDISIFKLQYLV